jgi:hypothetical protein
MDQATYVREVTKDRRFAIALGLLAGAALALIATNSFLVGVILGLGAAVVWILWLEWTRRTFDRKSLNSTLGAERRQDS